MPVEIIGNFSVRAEPVEAFLGFFSRIRCSVKIVPRRHFTSCIIPRPLSPWVR